MRETGLGLPCEAVAFKPKYSYHIHIHSQGYEYDTLQIRYGRAEVNTIWLTQQNDHIKEPQADSGDVVGLHELGC